MPDYDEAIEKLKEQVAKDSSETKETESLETTSD
jgi:hypothetical protein